jgi:hypothetical protein
VKKSAATMLSAWPRRNSDQLGPARRGEGIDPRAPEDVADRRRRELVAELLKLALYAQVPPNAVLAGEAHDEVPELPRGSLAGLLLPHRRAGR